MSDYSLKDAVHCGDIEMVKELVRSNGLPYDNPYSRGYSLLWKALEMKHVEVAHFLLNEGAQVNKITQPNPASRPIHLAVSLGNLGLVEELLKRGARVNSLNKKRETPLHLAACNGHKEIIRLLLINGASVNAKDKQGETALSITCQMNRFSERSVNKIERLVLILLENKADVNVKDNYGYTPLHNAIGNGNLTLVKLLIERKANVNSSTNRGISPLHVAAGRGDEHIVLLLLNNNAFIDAQDDKGTTPLHEAIKKHYLEITKILLSRDANVNANEVDNKSPLHTAVECNEETITSLLLDNNADLEVSETHRGYRPIHYAIGCVKRRIFSYEIKKGNQKIIDLLLSKGVNVNSNTKRTDSSSPLHLAISHRDQETARKLVENGADVDITDRNNKTPLRLAVELGFVQLAQEILQINSQTDGKSTLKAAVFSEERSADEIVKILLKYGYTFDADYIEDCELMKKCVERGYYELVECLLNHGANPGSGNGSLLRDAISNGQYEIVELLPQTKCDVNAKSMKAGETLIHLAIRKGYEKIVKLLLESGANIEDNFKLLQLAVQSRFVKVCKVLLDFGLDVNSCDECGRTVLYYALHKDIIALLIQNGANIDSKDERGRTALHTAIVENELVKVTYLLEYDHDADARDDDGDTALHLAAREGLTSVVERLVYKGFDVNATNTLGKTPLREAIDRNPYVGAISFLTYHTFILKAAGSNAGSDVGKFDCAKFEECKAELKKIKDRNIFLHNALIKCCVPKLSEDLIKILESIDYKEFPMYGALMEENLKNITLRSKLISLGTESFCALNRVRELPVEIVEKIVCELGNGSLNRLISCSKEFKDKWTINTSTSAGNVKITSVTRKL